MDNISASFCREAGGHFYEQKQPLEHQQHFTLKNKFTSGQTPLVQPQWYRVHAKKT